MRAPDPGRPSAVGFPSTHWGRVLAAGGEDPGSRVLMLRYFARLAGSCSCKKGRDPSQRLDPWILTSRGRSLAVVMVADSVPGLKSWISKTGLKDSAKLLVIRMVVSFLLRAGRMSCLRAAGA